MSTANRIGWASALIVGTSLLLSACSPSNQPDETPTFGQRYKFADNEIAGWKQKVGTSAYSVWTPANLTDKIDGGAPIYVERGFRTAMYQDLVGPDPSLCTVVAMDFGTEAQAKTMATFQKQATNAEVAIPQYDSSVAMASEGITGITVFAYFKSSYFELQLDGYSDPASAASAAQKFLEVLKRKTQ